MRLGGEALVGLRPVGVRWPEVLLRGHAVHPGWQGVGGQGGCGMQLGPPWRWQRLVLQGQRGWGGWWRGAWGERRGRAGSAALLGWRRLTPGADGHACPCQPILAPPYCITHLCCPADPHCPSAAGLAPPITQHFCRQAGRRSRCRRVAEEFCYQALHRLCCCAVGLLPQIQTSHHHCEPHRLCPAGGCHCGADSLRAGWPPSAAI